jgi:hypothetical protein
MNRLYEQVKVRGLFSILGDFNNGRIAHDVKCLQSALKNWDHLLEVRDEFTPDEIENLRDIAARAKRMIRREREIKIRCK